LAPPPPAAAASAASGQVQTPVQQAAPLGQTSQQAAGYSKSSGLVRII